MKRDGDGNFDWQWYLVRAFGFTDAYMLGGVFWAETMAKEWLSIEQQPIEWALLAATVLLWIYQVCLWPPRWWHALYFVWLGWLVFVNFFNITACRHHRMYKMLDIRQITRRLYWIGATLAMFGADFILDHYHAKHYGWWGDWATLFYMLLTYSTSLPSCGTRGGRRRLSREKLKELLGNAGDWLPEPEGAGV